MCYWCGCLPKHNRCCQWNGDTRHHVNTSQSLVYWIKWNIDSLLCSSHLKSAPELWKSIIVTSTSSCSASSHGAIWRRQRAFPLRTHLVCICFVCRILLAVPQCVVGWWIWKHETGGKQFAGDLRTLESTNHLLVIMYSTNDNLSIYTHCFV